MNNSKANYVVLFEEKTRYFSDHFARHEFITAENDGDAEKKALEIFGHRMALVQRGCQMDPRSSHLLAVARILKRFPLSE